MSKKLKNEVKEINQSNSNNNKETYWFGFRVINGFRFLPRVQIKNRSKPAVVRVPEPVKPWAKN